MEDMQLAPSNTVQKKTKKLLEIAFMKMPPREVHPLGFSEATGEISESDIFKCDF
jgi:hypothetical protein